MAIWGAWIVREKEMHLVGLPESFEGKVEIWEKQTEERKIPIALREMRWKEGAWQITVKQKLVLGHHYQVAVGGKVVNAFWPYEYVARLCPDPGDDLGFREKDGQWQFKLWSPTAQDVQLLLYQSPHGPGGKKIAMQRGKSGVWHVKIPVPASEGPFYYQYQVTALCHCRKVLDPYARAMAAFDPNSSERVGRAIALWPKMEKVPERERPRTALAMQGEVPPSFVASECHVRDVTIDPSAPVADKLKGTFLGLAQMMPYFKKLGVSHLQLLPCQKFFTVKETQRKFQGEDVPPGEINYNWGYDAHHFFIPQGQYVVDLANPTARITEFRALTKAAHAAGIGIILDVVYNHVFEGRAIEDAAPGLYLRRQANTYVSKGSGAGDSLETRSPLMRKLIIDSLAYWYEELGVDGFRFDLMGFIDHQTMQMIRRRLPKAVLYGEAWNFTDLPPAEATTKNNLVAAAAFNDSCRDAMLGSVHGRGWSLGNFAAVSSVKAAIIGGLQNFIPPYGEVAEDDYQRFAVKPEQTINFLTVHDGFTLWDKINLSVAGDQAYKERLMRQAFFMLLTTQGRIVLQGGDEIARTKPCGKNDPVPERSVQSKEALTFFCHDHFHENSYHSPDFTNRWDWARGKDFASLQKFVQGLVHLRRANSAWQARTVQEVQQRLHFLGRPENKVLDLPGDHARYRAWEDLKKLDLVFLNVPADWRGKTLYLAGGVHPADPNPRTPFAVHFDQNGRGVIHFTRAQIKKFNQGIWGKREEVQFKLVVAPGSWQVPYPLYQDNGCHSLSYQDILKGDVAVIDLGLSHHHRPGEIVYYPQNIIAFTLANTPGAQNLGPAGATPLPFPELLIIHYAGDEKTSFPLPAGPTWQWLADSGTGELWPQLQKTSGEIKNNTITLEGHCSVMLGRGRKTASAKKRHH